MRRLMLAFGSMALVVACGARTPLLVDQGEDVAGAGPGSVIPRHTKPADKIDLLFMIDNSSSMADKQELLKQAVPDLVNRLVNPKCVDPGDPNKVLGTSRGSECTVGELEFPAVHDLHVGIVTSSLGGRGSDSCPEQSSPHDPSLLAHDNDRGHLINRGGTDEHIIADALPSNFLAWAPAIGRTGDEPDPGTVSLQDPARFAVDFQDLVTGVHEYGCGYEAQLESWYRFLIQPDPYREIRVEAGRRATLVGVDDVILKQRHDFLRPDSLVAIILLTDENDSTVDPLSLDGEGWKYVNRQFPGSSTGGSPRPTAACAVSPQDAACRSCLSPSAAHDPSCSPLYYARAEDPSNARLFHMKERFGVDPQFPVERYVNALTSPTVPSRAGEHLEGKPDYVGTRDCSNPLFSTNLPTDPRGELCQLKRGPRALDLVYFAVIGGVPNTLLHFDPTSPERSKLDDGDWLRILGRDPLRYDFSGLDPHMVESIAPRPGLPAPDAPDLSDPIHGREWDTKKGDLQYACTFTLPAPKDCTQGTVALACDCARGKATPLCDPQNPNIQIRGKAYPPVRELAVTRALKEQGIVASLCPIHSTPATADDPLYGYRPAMKTIIDRLKLGLK